MKVDKSKFDNSWYKPGPFWKRTLWYYVSVLFFSNSLFPFTKFKVFILRLFGATIGTNCYIKPGVNIKYPWFLMIGDNVGIGENAWIDNLGMVTLGDNSTISQGAMLITGNHDFNSPAYDLIVTEIHIKEGAWIAAKAVVGPGVTVHKNTILALGAQATKDLEENSIYVGIPAVRIKERFKTKR